MTTRSTIHVVVLKPQSHHKLYMCDYKAQLLLYSTFSLMHAVESKRCNLISKSNRFILWIQCIGLNCCQAIWDPDNLLQSLSSNRQVDFPNMLSCLSRFRVWHAIGLLLSILNIRWWSLLSTMYCCLVWKPGVSTHFLSTISKPCFWSAGSSARLPASTCSLAAGRSDARRC